MAYISEAKDLLQKYSSYCILDIETTDCSSSDLIQIYAAKFDKNWNRMGEFYFVRKLNRALTPSTILKTGITDSLLNKEGKSLSFILKKFVEFAEESLLISHECNFLKLPVLSTNLKEQKIYFKLWETIDTKILSKELFPDQKSHEFVDLCSKANLEYKKGLNYRVVYDSKLLKEIMLYFVHNYF